MRSPAAIILALLILRSAAASGAEPPVADASAMLQKSFEDRITAETPPPGANGIEKAAWHVRRQLTGRDFYEPANYMYLRQAVKEIGLVPAFFSTADRILRDSRMGTAGTRLDASNPVIKEGPEAYAPRRSGK